MPFDFETIIDRRSTHALKWDNTHHGEELDAVIPLWVADMDFAVPPAVTEALAERVAHPVFGYTNLPKAYFEAVCAWNASRSGRTLTPAQLLLAPSVLHAMSMALRTFTAPGDAILNLPPVYYPFFKMVDLHERVGLEVPLVRSGKRWEVDLVSLRTSLAAARSSGLPVKALLFSNPQNPTGRCWTLPELEALGALAVEFDFLLFSDEIHSDLISPGGRHISLADLPELSSRTLVFAGPNKTFNLAGLPISHVVVRDATLRRRLKRTIESDFFDQPNVLSMTAALTAYQQGAPWLDHLLGVIQANYRRLEKFLAGRGLEAYPMEATYLAWVDCTPLITQLGLASDKELAAWMEETVRVKPTAGSLYGNGGRNHLRFNLATPPALLQQALDRLDAALPKRP